MRKRRDNVWSLVCGTPSMGRSYSGHSSYSQPPCIFGMIFLYWKNFPHYRFCLPEQASGLLIPSLSGSLQANGLGALGLTLAHKACIQREQAPRRASVSHCPDGGGGLPRVCSSWGRGVSGGGCGGDSCLIRLVPQHGLGFPDGWVGKEFTCSACRRHRRRGLGPWIGKISWRGIQQSTPVILT